MSGRPVSVRRLLRRRLAILVVLVLLIGGLALVDSIRERHAFQRTATQIVPMQLANLRLIDYAERTHRSYRSYLLFGGTMPRARYLQARTELPVRIAEVRRLDRQGGAAQWPVGRMMVRLEKWLTFVDATVDAVEPASAQAAERVQRSGVLFEQFQDAAEAFDDHLSARFLRVRGDGERQRTITLITLFVIVVLTGLLAAFTAWRTMRTLTRPLGAMEHGLERLAAGDTSVRLPEIGPAELRLLSRGINVVALESERTRQQEQHRQLLRRAAYEIGNRIRESLDADTVMTESVKALGDRLDVRRVSLHLVRGDQIGPAEVEWRDGRMRDEPLQLPLIPIDYMVEILKQGRAFAGRSTDIPESVGGINSATVAMRQALADLGDEALIAAPFGIGGELMGAVLLSRPWDLGGWQPEEIATAEAVALDIARGLQHARLFQQQQEVVAELRALDQTKGDFLANISHELRSPLTSMSGYLEVLRDGDAGEVTQEQDEMLEVLQRNTTRLLTLIEDILLMSRIESGGFSSRLRPTDLCEPLSAAIETARPAATAAGIVLDAQLPQRGMWVLGDSHQLERAVGGVLHNAVKFTGQGGSVRVTMTQDDRSAVVTVRDTGIGVPRQERRKMFTQFFRGSNAVQQEIGGTGLGLSIVRSVIANHNAEIDIDSVEGQGTTVTMRFALVAETSVPAASPEQ